MRQHLPDGYIRIRKFGKEFLEPIAVAEFAFFLEQKDAHGGELFSDRSCIKQAVLVQRLLGVVIGIAKRLLIDDISVFCNEDVAVKVVYFGLPLHILVEKRRVIFSWLRRAFCV